MDIFQLITSPAVTDLIDNFLFYDKLARHKKITYTLHSELEDKEELFDPNYLELIVNNLLSNAFKYTESGQSITVTLKEENNWLVLQVSETGIGIPIINREKYSNVLSDRE